MQLSAANLLIASQQVARGVTRAQRDDPAQFAAARAKEESATSAAAFEPIGFKPLAAPSRIAAVAAAPTASSRTGKLGAKLDIRV